MQSQPSMQEAEEVEMPELSQLISALTEVDRAPQTSSNHNERPFTCVSDVLSRALPSGKREGAKGSATAKVRKSSPSPPPLSSVDCFTPPQLAHLKACLLCPLCRTLMTDDAAFVDMCGHTFCYDCINIGSEEGCESLEKAWPWSGISAAEAAALEKEEKEETAERSVSSSRQDNSNGIKMEQMDENGIGGGEENQKALHKQQKRRRQQSRRSKKLHLACPLCKMPVQKASLRKLAPLQDFCIAIQAAYPALEQRLQQLTAAEVLSAERAGSRGDADKMSGKVASETPRGGVEAEVIVIDSKSSDLLVHHSSHSFRSPAAEPAAAVCKEERSEGAEMDEDGNQEMDYRSDVSTHPPDGAESSSPGIFVHRGGSDTQQQQRHLQHQTPMNLFVHPLHAATTVAPNMAGGDEHNGGNEEDEEDHRSTSQTVPRAWGAPGSQSSEAPPPPAQHSRSVSVTTCSALPLRRPALIGENSNSTSMHAPCSAPTAAPTLAAGLRSEEASATLRMGNEDAEGLGGSRVYVVLDDAEHAKVDENSRRAKTPDAQGVEESVAELESRFPGTLVVLPSPRTPFPTTSLLPSTPSTVVHPPHPRSTAAEWVTLPCPPWLRGASPSVCVCRTTAGGPGGEPYTERVTPASAAALVAGRPCVSHRWARDGVSLGALASPDDAGILGYLVCGVAGSGGGPPASPATAAARQHKSEEAETVAPGAAFEIVKKHLLHRFLRTHQQQQQQREGSTPQPPLPGSWMREAAQRYLFAIIPDAWQRRLAECVAEAWPCVYDFAAAADAPPTSGAVSALCEQVKQRFQHSLLTSMRHYLAHAGAADPRTDSEVGASIDATFFTCEGYSIASWHELCVTAGAGVVLFPPPLFVALATQGLERLLSLFLAATGDGDGAISDVDIVSLVDELLVKLRDGDGKMSCFTENVSDDAARLRLLTLRGLDGKDSGATDTHAPEASPHISLVLLYNSRLTRQALQGAAAAVPTAHHPASAKVVSPLLKNKLYFLQVFLHFLAMSVADLVRAARVPADALSGTPPPPCVEVDVDTRSAGWLLKNIAECRPSAGANNSNWRTLLDAEMDRRAPTATAGARRAAHKGKEDMLRKTPRAAASSSEQPPSSSGKRARRETPSQRPDMRQVWYGDTP